MYKYEQLLRYETSVSLLLAYKSAFEIFETQQINVIWHNIFGHAESVFGKSVR
jgi:hypothetical protein